MSTRHEKDNMGRLVHEAMTGMSQRDTLQQAFDSAELNGVPKVHVVEIVAGVFGVVENGSPADVTLASVLAMVECAYPPT